ncbi:hypothetical protein TNCV_2118961 [Trichonephila clavipes]|nr:hypothetical protein TNCV_2118961 [Trichonephila clavipes]
MVFCVLQIVTGDETWGHNFEPKAVETCEFTTTKEIKGRACAPVLFASAVGHPERSDGPHAASWLSITVLELSLTENHFYLRLQCVKFKVIEDQSGDLLCSLMNAISILLHGWLHIRWERDSADIIHLCPKFKELFISKWPLNYATGCGESMKFSSSAVESPFEV